MSFFSKESWAGALDSAVSSSWPFAFTDHLKARYASRALAALWAEQTIDPTRNLLDAMSPTTDRQYPTVFGARNDVFYTSTSALGLSGDRTLHFRATTHAAPTVMETPLFRVQEGQTYEVFVTFRGDSTSTNNKLYYFLEWYDSNKVRIGGSVHTANAASASTVRTVNSSNTASGDTAPSTCRFMRVMVGQFSSDSAWNLYVDEVRVERCLPSGRSTLDGNETYSSAGSPYRIPYDTVDFQRGINTWDAKTLTIREGGRYFLEAHARTTHGTGFSIGLDLYKNSALYAHLDDVQTTANGAIILAGGTLVEAVRGDVFEFYLTTNDAGVRTLDGSSAYTYSTFHKIGTV